MALITSKAELTNMINLQGELIARQEGIIKTIGLKTKDFLKIFGLDGKKNDKLNDPYKQLPTVYSCIRAKANNLSQVPFKLYREDKEITSGQMYELLHTINPTMNPTQFMEALPTSLDVDGNAYIVFDKEFVNGLPVYLWVFSPKWVTPAFSRSGTWTGWWLQRGGKGEKEFVEPERVIQIKYYNPNNELLGFNPLEVLKLTSKTLWAAGMYNYNFFENDATPPFVYKSPSKPGERQIKELKEKLIEKRRGLAKAHEPDILFGGMEVQTVGLSQKDVQFLQQIKLSREDICMVYGVPKKIISIYEDINYATAEIAELQFWEDTIIPMARLIEAGLNDGLLRPNGYRGAFDFSAIDVLNKRVLEKVDTVVKLLATGQFTRNELNQKFKLGFEPVEWGDEPINLMPTFEAQAAAPTPPAVKQIPSSVPDIPVQRADRVETSVDEALLAAKWAKDIIPLVPIMSKAARSVRRYFYDVEQEIMRSLTKKVDGVYYTKAESLEDVPFQEIEAAFSDEKLYLAMKEYLEESIERGFLSIMQTGFRMDNKFALRILNEKRIKVIEMNNTGKSEIVEELRKVIEEGLSEGIGSDALARAISDALTGKMKDIQKRAATIARTEVNSSFSMSRWSAVEQDPPDKIRWIASNDSKMRDSHRHLNGRVVEYGKKFENGCRYPHDPNGAAGEVINCRCSWEPIWGEEDEL